MRWVGVFLLGLVLVVCGCRNPEDAPVSVPDDASLMRIAFPGWSPDGPTSTVEMQVPAQDTNASSPKQVSERLAVSPSVIARQGNRRLVLIVKGSPAEDNGEVSAAHVSPGYLGAYWFEFQNGHWVEVAEKPIFTATGFSGDPGTVQLVRLAPDTQAVAVENGSCWQGNCGQWISLYEIGALDVRPLLDAVSLPMTASSNTGTAESCDDLSKLVPGSHKNVPTDDYPAGDGCYAVSSTWFVAPGRGGPGDLVLDFTGSTTSEEPVMGGFNVTVNAVRARVVYRYKKGHYALYSGKNPAPSF